MIPPISRLTSIPTKQEPLQQWLGCFRNRVTGVRVFIGEITKRPHCFRRDVPFVLTRTNSRSIFIQRKSAERFSSTEITGKLLRVYARLRVLQQLPKKELKRQVDVRRGEEY
jgi:hypothetical protein